MKKVIFKGAGVAIVTPFDKNGEVDYSEFARLIEFQIANDTDAIIVCGTTGEAATLSEAERAACVQFAVGQVAGRVPVIAGSGSNSTAHAVESTRLVKELGADAALVVTPYYNYNKPAQEGLYRHYMTIADSCDIPLIVYNVPSRTGTNILPETYARLCRHPNINSVKEANGNMPAMIRTVALCGDNINIYSGEDPIIVPMLCMGALGVISVLSNVCPKQTHDMCRLWFEGKAKEAAALQTEYSALISALFCDVSPIPVKAALNMMGYNVGQCRLPLAEMSEQGLKQLTDAMRAIGLL